MTEQERKVKFTTVLVLMNELMMKTGNNAAPDYDGVNDWDDIIFYLKSHIKSLPQKGIEDNYWVENLETKILKTEPQKKKKKKTIVRLLEDDLIDAVRDLNMGGIKKIQEELNIGINLADDYREDLMLKLYESRAKVLSRMLSYVKGLISVKQIGKTVVINSTEPWTNEMLNGLKEVVQHESNVELGLIISNLRTDVNDDHVITWNWVE